MLSVQPAHVGDGFHVKVEEGKLQERHAQLPGLSEDSFNFLWSQLGDISEHDDYVDLDNLSDTSSSPSAKELSPCAVNVEDSYVAFSPAELPVLPSDVLSEDSHIPDMPDSPQSYTSSEYAAVSSTVSRPSTTVPTDAAYAGQYGFQMSFQKPPKETKSTSWTYSPNHNKLFVRMATACPILFRTNTPPPPGTFIRATPVYMKPEHSQDIVRRCPNHTSGMEHNEGHPAPSHLLRCEHPMAMYTEDSASRRHSVVAPLDQPQVGASWTTYLYQFMCFSSCVGGLNRRPVQVIFTLENSGAILGRQAVEVRICACPGRDRRVDENASLPAASRPSKRSAPSVSVNPSKRMCGDQEVFTLQIKGRANYEMLCRLRDSLELAALIPQDQAAQLLQHHYQKA